VLVRMRSISSATAAMLFREARSFQEVVENSGERPQGNREMGCFEVVGASGFEPPTFGSSAKGSGSEQELSFGKLFCTVFIFLFGLMSGETVSESSDRFAETFPQLRQLLGAKYQEENCEDNQKVCRLQ
jgi:hypothetical protein